MKRWFATFAILSLLFASGCGGGDQGPADPSETPEVSEEDVQKAIESSMPADMMKQYGKSPGGGPPANP